MGPPIASSIYAGRKGSKPRYSNVSSISLEYLPTSAKNSIQREMRPQLTYILRLETHYEITQQEEGTSYD